MDRDARLRPGVSLSAAVRGAVDREPATVLEDRERPNLRRSPQARRAQPHSERSMLVSGDLVAVDRQVQLDGVVVVRSTQAREHGPPLAGPRPGVLQLERQPGSALAALPLAMPQALELAGERVPDRLRARHPPQVAELVGVVEEVVELLLPRPVFRVDVAIGAQTLVAARVEQELAAP